MRTKNTMSQLRCHFCGESYLTMYRAPIDETLHKELCAEHYLKHAIEDGIELTLVTKRGWLTL